MRVHAYLLGHQLIENCIVLLRDGLVHVFVVLLVEVLQFLEQEADQDVRQEKAVGNEIRWLDLPSSVHFKAGGFDDAVHGDSRHHFVQAATLSKQFADFIWSFVVNSLYISCLGNELVIIQVETVDFAQEIGVLLEFKGEWLAQDEQQVNVVEDESVARKGREVLHLGLGHVEADGLPHPQQNSVLAVVVLHQLLDDVG